MTASTAPALHVAEIRRALGISRERMGRLLDVSARTIERWEERDTLPANVRLRQRLAEIHEVADLARQVYDADGVGLFFTTPLPALDGRTALQTIEMGDTARVFGVLASAYEGTVV